MATAAHSHINGGTALHNAALRRSDLQVLSVPVGRRERGDFDSDTCVSELRQQLQRAGVPLRGSATALPVAQADGTSTQGEGALRWGCEVLAAWRARHAEQSAAGCAALPAAEVANAKVQLAADARAGLLGASEAAMPQHAITSKGP